MVLLSARWSDLAIARAERKRTHERNLSCEQTLGVGAYAYQHLNLVAKGKAHGREIKASDRTWEIRPSGIRGGLGKRHHGGIVNPLRN